MNRRDANRIKEKIQELFKEYYNDETMPVIELEDKVLNECGQSCASQQPSNGVHQPIVDETTKPPTGHKALPSEGKIRAWIAHRALKNCLLVGSRTKPIYLEDLIIEFVKSLQQENQTE
jgi:hypothetical protein